MNIKIALGIALFSASLLALPSWADDESDELDVSLTVVGAADSAEAAINSISLPEQASEEARANAAAGLETANAARQKGLEKSAEGQAKAREARANASDMANEAGSQARERVKSDIAQGALERIPTDVRENLPGTVPGRPENPGNPGR